MQLEDPSSECPDSHGVHKSDAPMLKWFAGQFSTPDLSAFTFVPAGLVLQKEAPLSEYTPTPTQLIQATAPKGAYFPLSHSTHPFSTTIEPGRQYEQAEDWGVDAYIASPQGVHSSDPPMLYFPATQGLQSWSTLSA